MRKYCPQCQKYRNVLGFHKNKTRSDGLSYRCIICTKKYYQENKEKLRTYSKKWRQEHKEQTKANNKKWNQKNKEKIKEWNLKHKKERNINNKIRRQHDLNYKIAENLRSRMYKAIRNNQKTGSAIRDLGCSIEKFIEYIETFFTESMTWENYGEWHLDHIKPLAAFDLTDRKQFLQAAHYTNYQPLWAKDNLVKKDSITIQQ